MNATDAAVLAGAKAWHRRNQSGRLDSGRLDANGKPWQWEDLLESDQRAYLALAREVVVPALAAIGIGHAEQAAS